MRSTEGALDGLAGRGGEDFASGGFDVEEENLVEGKRLGMDEMRGEVILEEKVDAVDEGGVCGVFL